MRQWVAKRGDDEIGIDLSMQADLFSSLLHKKEEELQNKLFWQFDFNKYYTKNIDYIKVLSALMFTFLGELLLFYILLNIILS